jgi:hypothetical protein
LKFNKGDIGYHKATNKRCVISDIGDNGRVFVTTEDGEKTVYQPEELWTEQEWKDRNRDDIAATKTEFGFGE